MVFPNPELSTIQVPGVGGESIVKMVKTQGDEGFDAGVFLEVEEVESEATSAGEREENGLRKGMAGNGNQIDSGETVFFVAGIVFVQPHAEGVPGGDGLARFGRIFEGGIFEKVGFGKIAVCVSAK